MMKWARISLSVAVAGAIILGGGIVYATTFGPTYDLDGHWAGFWSLSSETVGGVTHPTDLFLDTDAQHEAGSASYANEALLYLANNSVRGRAALSGGTGTVYTDSMLNVNRHKNRAEVVVQRFDTTSDAGDAWLRSSGNAEVLCHGNDVVITLGN